MSAGRQVPELRIALRVSRTLAVALACAHLAAAWALSAALPQLHWRVLAGLVLLANGCWTMRRHALLRERGAVVALEFRGESDCVAHRRGCDSLSCRVQGSSFVSTWLIVLHLRECGRRFDRHVVILPDGIDADRLRRLRVRLRWASVQTRAIGVNEAPL